MAAQIPARNEVKTEDAWNLSKMYASIKQWQKDYKLLESECGKYDSYKGRFEESADIFFDALEFDLEISRKIEKVYVYAHLVNDQDKTDNQGETLYQKAVSLYTKISEKSSYIGPEIQAITDEKMNSYLGHERASAYQFYLEKILRYKKHTLSHEAEEILAMSSETFSAPQKIFSQLDNADLKFGTLKNGKGEEKELSHGNFNTFLMDADRSVREKAFFQYYEMYENHKYALGATLSSSIKKDWLKARLRKYPSCRAASLYSDNVSETVYDNLVASVRKNIASLTEYMHLRKKILGLDDLHFYDTYVPIVKDVDFSMTYEEAVETCVAALKPLGEEYTGILKDGLLNGWVDRYENRGKRSGAYSSGCFDSDPYILMNYESRNINSLYTLIHEAGHSMHSYYSARSQPYHYHDYTIFVAEVASTFNETLLSYYLMEKYADNKQMRSYIINRELENLRGTLFRQTMFAEFEKISHDLVEQDTPLTVDSIRAEYRKLLEAYFSDSLVIDDVLELECFRIPHFYSAFYVYKYATGISAAVSLAEKVMSGADGAVDNYLKFLTLGGSMFPVDELKVAGVDMTQAGPVDRALGRFSELVAEFQK